MQTLKSFKEWGQRARPGDTFIYYNTTTDRRSPAAFDYARELAEAGDFALFQLRYKPTNGPAQFAYYAQALSARSARFLQEVSAWNV